jgi:hypothetical protein
MAKRGMLNPSTQRTRRYAQLEIEESVAAGLRDQGWEIYSPTVVCDRIGIKDGKLFLLEFKPESNQSQARTAKSSEMRPGNVQGSGASGITNIGPAVRATPETCGRKPPLRV